MEGLSLNLPLLLQTVNNVLVAPANLVGQTLQNRSVCWLVYRAYQNATHLHSAVLPARLQPQYPESLRDDHALLAIVGRRNTLKQLEALKSSRTAGSLVGDHSADGPVENLGGCAVMERTRLFRVDNVTFVEEVVVSQLHEGIEISVRRVRPNGCN